MDITTLTTLIGSFGFPIVACIGMGWYINKTNKEHREEIRELNEEHKTEVSKMTEALNNNTLVLQKLCDRMDGEK